MILTDISQLTPEWLTEALGTPVVGFEVTRSGTTNVSTVHHLKAAHTDPTLPDHLFLKLVKVSHPEFFGKELTFYREIAPVVRARFPDFTALHCYAADYDPVVGHACLLFEDLSATHFGIDERQPTYEHYAQVIDGFAMLHATWWEHPRLGADLGDAHTAESLDTILQRAQDNYAGLVAEHPDLDPAWRGALSGAVRQWSPRRREQMHSGKQMALVHRDPHPRNFLYPRENSSDQRAIIIDWDAWRVDHGTVDLAYMMGCRWSAALRGAYEMPLLRHYHQRLEHYGITGCTWEDLLQDYRISLVRCLLFMLGAWRSGRHPGEVWWQIVDGGVRAYHDLGCDAVVGFNTALTNNRYT